MPALSATTLKLYQDCPRCFWLHVKQKVERPRGPFPSLPSGIDRVLKVYFDDYRQRGTLPPIIDGKLPGTLASQPLTLGFTDEEIKARLWGKLDDCVRHPDGRLAPLDHKTRASAPGEGYTEKYYQTQMNVYTLLLERAGHRTTHTAHVVYYYPVDGVLHKGFPFEVAVQTVRTDPDAAYEAFINACACLDGPLPPSGEACEYCRWAAARRAYDPSGPEAPRAYGKLDRPVGPEVRNADSPSLLSEPPARKSRGRLDKTGDAPPIPTDLFTPPLQEGAGFT